MKKILIYGGTGIGDFVMHLYMAKCIKKEYPNSYIFYFNSADKKLLKKTIDVFKIQSCIDAVGSYSYKNIFRSIWFYFQLKLKKFDIGFVEQYVDNSSLSLWPYRISKRVCKELCGIETKCKNIRFDYNVPRTQGSRKITNQISMLEKVNFPSVCEYPLFDIERINNKLKKIGISDEWKKNGGIILAVGAEPVHFVDEGTNIFINSKKWPIEKWIELALLLSKKHNVVLMGGTKEKIEYESKGICLNDRVINALGLYSVDESIAIMSKAKIVVGADTGLMHCAGALDLPSLTLFGCTDYKEYLPIGNKAFFLASQKECSPCFGTMRIALCKNNDCMSEILVENVYNKINDIINKTN